MRLFPQPRSIAFHLIVAVLAVELVSSVLVVVLSFGYERHAHFRAFDVLIHGRADSVLGAVQDAEDGADNVMLDQADLHLPHDDIYEVYGENGRLLGRSTNWQGAGVDVFAAPKDGYAELTVNGRQYKVIRIHGFRTVDPGAPGGGKLRKVTILYGAPTEHVWNAIRGAVEFYAAGSVLLLIVTGPLIAWLLHRGLLPLRQLATMASEVSVDDWHFDPPASARNTPELAPLTEALESVLQRLERSFVQQKTFVSDAAHELKTAVAVVKSSLQLLTMKRRTGVEYKAGLERCLADCLRLEEIVAKMLTLAREESAGDVAGTAPAGDLTGCIWDVISQLDSVAALREVQVVFAETHAEFANGQIAVAEEDCTLLVSNLLLNALQHGPPASTVEIRLSIDGDDAVLEIEDHGDGIDAEALPHVFDRFFRGDPSRTRNTGGTGLGLAICKAIAHKAGGTIELASQRHQGTTARVRLPLTRTIDGGLRRLSSALGKS
ncbi:MAG: ATP-binding protein [Terracidiphilus sp.]|jgi:signal transduction histidine kinase